MTYSIHESLIDKLEKKLTTIQNKCEKYGCDFYYKEVGEVFKTFEENFDADGNRLEEPIEITRRFVVIEVEGKCDGTVNIRPVCLCKTFAAICTPSVPDTIISYIEIYWFS